jgi:hypothetical protein
VKSLRVCLSTSQVLYDLFKELEGLNLVFNVVMNLLPPLPSSTSTTSTPIKSVELECLLNEIFQLCVILIQPLDSTSTAIPSTTQAQSTAKPIPSASTPKSPTSTPTTANPPTQILTGMIPAYKELIHHGFVSTVISGLFGVALEDAEIAKALYAAFSEILNGGRVLTEENESKGEKRSAKALLEQMMRTGSSIVWNPTFLRDICDCLVFACLPFEGLALDSEERMKAETVHMELIEFVLKVMETLSTKHKYNQIQLTHAGIVESMLSWICDGSSNKKGFGEEIDDVWFLDTSNHSGQNLSILENLRVSCFQTVFKTLKTLVEYGLRSHALKKIVTKYSSSELSAKALVATNHNGQNSSALNSSQCITSPDHDKLVSSPTTMLPSSKSEHKFEALLDLLNHSVKSSWIPASFHFNNKISSAGYLHLPALPGKFPPHSGYTYTSWVHVSAFDPNFDIPLIELYEPDSKCVRLRVVIERQGSQSIRVETYKSTVIFGGVALKENMWYHLALVHTKPRMTASSIILYINGMLVDNVKCGYLGHPGTVIQLFILYLSINL